MLKFVESLKVSKLNHQQKKVFERNIKRTNVSLNFFGSRISSIKHEISANFKIIFPVPYPSILYNPAYYLLVHRFTLRRVLDYLVSTVGYFYYFGMSNGLAVDILFACINLS